MTINELKTMIKGLSGATMVRVGRTNYVAIPCEDGVAKIAVTSALAEATKNREAFDLASAQTAYKAWEEEKVRKETERAAKPPRVAGPNPEAQARRDELDAKVSALPVFTHMTATNIRDMLAGQIADNVTVMAVGQSAHRLVDKGVLTVEVEEKKSYYTKA